MAEFRHGEAAGEGEGADIAQVLLVMPPGAKEEDASAKQSELHAKLDDKAQVVKGEHLEDGDEPAFIRMSVFNKKEERYEIKVQFPVAFARMLIDSLGTERRDELRREAKRQGMNIDRIFDAIRRSGTGRLLEVDTGDSVIEIWIE